MKKQNIHDPPQRNFSNRRIANFYVETLIDRSNSVSIHFRGNINASAHPDARNDQSNAKFVARLMVSDNLWPKSFVFSTQTVKNDSFGNNSFRSLLTRLTYSTKKEGEKNWNFWWNLLPVTHYFPSSPWNIERARLLSLVHRESHDTVWTNGSFQACPRGSKLCRCSAAV